jgi:hypothetical protein
MKTAAILTVSLIAFGVVGTGVLGGCRDRDRTGYDRERERPVFTRDPNEQDKSGTTTLTGASWVANDTAIDRITSSRCTREMTCSNVGPDKHFATPDVCVLEVRKRTREDLKPAECPTGIDGVALDKCLEAVRTESCSNPLDTLGRLASCRSGELCLKTETPHR